MRAASCLLLLLCWARPGVAQTDRVPSSTQDTTTRPWKPGAPKVFGYVQVHFRHAVATGTDSLVDYDDFRVQRVRVGVKGDVLSWLSYDVEIDPRAPEISGILRDAYLAIHAIPRHQIRIGQQKTQFGYENRESSADLYAVNRTEVSDNLSRGVTLRDIGVGLIGNIKVGPKGFRIEDAITVVNGAGMNVQADDTPRKNVWGRLGVRWKRDTSGLVIRAGVSGGTGDLIDQGDPATPADDFKLGFNRVGGDLEIDHRLFFVAAEFVNGWDKISGSTEELHGWYVNLVGKTSLGIGPILRYDALGTDFKRWTLGAYYGLPEARFRVIVNYEYRKLKDGTRADDKVYAWTQIRF